MQTPDARVRIPGALLVVGGALLLLGSLMPWVKEGGFLIEASTSGLDLGAGVFTLVVGFGLIVVGAALVAGGDLPSAITAGASILGVIAGFVAWNAARSESTLRNLVSGGVTGSLPGVGSWLCVAGGVVAAVAFLLTPTRRQPSERP